MTWRRLHAFLTAALLCAACGSDDDSATDAGLAGDAAVPFPDAAADTPADLAGNAAADLPPPGSHRWVRLFTPGHSSVNLLVSDGAATLYAAQRTFDIQQRDVLRLSISMPLHRSTDLGASWAPISRPFSTYALHVLSIIGDRLYAGDDGGLRMSRDGGQTWTFGRSSHTPVIRMAGQGNLLLLSLYPAGWERSTDGGATFQSLSMSLPIDPKAPVAVQGETVLWVDGPYIVRSIDAGSTQSHAIVGRVPARPGFGQAVSFASATTAYAIIDQQLFGSSDAGATWNRIEFGETGYEVPMALAVGPGGDVYIGGDIGSGSPRRGFVARSKDGRSWDKQSVAPAPVSAIAFAGTAIALGTTRDGVFVSPDQGMTWRPASGPATGPQARGLGDVIYDAAFDVSASALGPSGDLYVGLSTDIVRSSDAAKTWAPLSMKLTERRPCFATALGTVLCGRYRSVDHGVSWTEMEFLGSVARFAGKGPTLYALGARLWRSDDEGKSWFDLGPRVGLSPALSNLAVAPDGSVFHANLRSRDRGQTWQDFGHVVAAADDANRLFEFTTTGVAISEDAGTNWRPLVVAGQGDVLEGTAFDQIVVTRAGRVFVHGFHAVTTASGGFPDEVFEGNLIEPSSFRRADVGLEQAFVREFLFDREGNLHANTSGAIYRFVP